MNAAEARNPDDRKPSSASSVGRKIIIKSADMKDDLQKEAIDIAIAAFEKHSVEKDVAEHIKKEFDKKHGPTWHCIVGRNFAPWSVKELLAACCMGKAFEIGVIGMVNDIITVRTFNKWKDLTGSVALWPVPM